MYPVDCYALCASGALMSAGGEFKALSRALPAILLGAARSSPGGIGTSPYLGSWMLSGASVTPTLVRTHMLPLSVPSQHYVMPRPAEGSMRSYRRCPVSPLLWCCFLLGS